MKNSLFSLLLAFSLFSCSNDDNVNNTENNHLKGKLKIVESTDSYTDDNGNPFEFTTKSIYEYDSKGYLIKRHRTEADGAHYATYFYYEGSKLIEEKSTLNETEFQKIQYEYSGDLIVKSTATNENNTYVTLYTYNSLNEMIKLEGLAADGSVSREEKFEYLNGNMVKKMFKLSNGSYHTYTYEFDNKNNPYQTAFVPANLKIDFFRGPNNLTNRDGSILTYEYNDQNFPTKVTENGYETRYLYY